MQFPKDLLIFCLSVDTWQTQTCFIVWKQDLRLYQIAAVYGIELVNDLTSLLDHWSLVFTNRNGGCLKCSNICCLADRVGKETNWDAGLEITHLDLGFYSRITL